MKRQTKGKVESRDEHPRTISRGSSIIIIFAALAFLMGLIPINCGDSGGSIPKATVKACMDAMKNGDFKTASRYIRNGGEQYDKLKSIGDLDRAQQMMKAMDFDINVLDEKIDGEKATVKVEVLMGGAVMHTDEMELERISGKWLIIEDAAFDSFK